jgi:glycosyltransferase involved in cell wall biosynthesis
LAWRRGSLNPFRLLAIARDVRVIYRKHSPDIVHHVALVPSIVGSLAAIGMPFVRLNALAGLGYAFSSNGIKARLLRPWLAWLLRTLFANPVAAVLVQNPDDRAMVTALGVAPERVFLIPGSGVDTDALRPAPEPDGPVTVTFVGRLLADKGIRTLIAAHDILRRRGEALQLLIAGDRDPANPASIPPSEIESWRQQPGVGVLGHVTDIGALWARSHIAVLPSRREGLPKSLLEAAACGRPIVASDVPGCREIARADVNALLVPPDDPQALAEAIARLAHDPDLRRRFGAAGRDMVEAEFASAHIGREIVARYDKLLGRTRALLHGPAGTG